MYKKTIVYEDFNGVERTEDFYFNLSKAELLEMELAHVGGFAAYVEKIQQTEDRESLLKLFRDLILKSYGEKDESGRRFIKSKELSEAFSQTNAFSELYMELASSSDAAAEFVNGLVPESLHRQLEAQN